MNKFSHGQEIALAFAPKLGAAPSIVGSSLILRDVYRRRTSGQWTPRDRIVAGMSICDIIGSIGWFLSTWPIPKEIKGVLFNVGTWGTCVFQGFITHWVAGAVLYNGCLALYYLLLIRQGYTNKRFAKRIEPTMHVIAIGFALVTSVAGVVLNIYNPREFGCYIAPLPPGCKKRPNVECIRGENAVFYRNWFLNYPVVGVILFVTVCMSLIFMKVRSVEKRAPRLQQSRLLRLVSIQCLLYSISFFLCWSFSVGAHIYWAVHKGKTFWLIFLSRFFIASQGFFNAIVYFLPVLMKIDLSPFGAEPMRALQRRLSQNSAQFIRRMSHFRSSDLTTTTSQRSSWFEQLREDLSSRMKRKRKGQASHERPFAQSNPENLVVTVETEITTQISLSSNSERTKTSQCNLTKDQIQSLIEIVDFVAMPLQNDSLVVGVDINSNNQVKDNENMLEEPQPAHPSELSLHLSSNAQTDFCHYNGGITNQNENHSTEKLTLRKDKLNNSRPASDTEVSDTACLEENLSQSTHHVRRWSWPLLHIDYTNLPSSAATEMEKEALKTLYCSSNGQQQPSMPPIRHELEPHNERLNEMRISENMTKDEDSINRCNRDMTNSASNQNETAAIEEDEEIADWSAAFEFMHQEPDTETLVQRSPSLLEGEQNISDKIDDLISQCEKITDEGDILLQLSPDEYHDRNIEPTGTHSNPIDKELKNATEDIDDLISQCKSAINEGAMLFQINTQESLEDSCNEINY